MSERQDDREHDLRSEADAELAFHIETLADRYVAEGLTREAALARARAEFGDREAALTRMVAIDRRHALRRRLTGLPGSVLRDIRYSARRLRRTPTFTIVAVLTLALGIGANSAIFSVVNGVLFAPFGFREPDRLAMVWNDNSRIGMRTDITSWATFEDWRAGSRSFEAMAGFRQAAANLAGDFEPERVATGLVSSEFFDVLGVRPAMGRTFTEAEMTEGAAAVVILGHGLWQTRFGGSPDVLGRTVRLDGIDYEVVGVMPPGFDFPERAALWAPLVLNERLRQSRGNYFLYVVGRLAPGASFEQAQAEMDVVAARLASEYPRLHEGLGVFVQPMREHLLGDVRPALLVLLGAVGLVLLIACANVANLMLARAATRHREVAVRLALGAGRGPVIRQLLTESVVVGVTGGVLGLALAYGGVRLLRAMAPADLPRVEAVAIDPTVLLFTLVLSVLTGLLFGLAPALQAGRGRQADALREASRGSVSARDGWRTRGLLVVSELALSLVLLIGAGLLIQSFVRLSRIDSGFNPDGVLTARIAVSGGNYTSREAVESFFDRLLERLRALPGVEQAAVGSSVLLAQLPRSASFVVEGQPPEPDAERIELTIDVVTPGYFAAIGTPLVMGRDISNEDRADGMPVAIVNQAMVRRYWPNESPLGKRFKFGDFDSEGPWITVVGVAADARRTSQEKEARPSAWMPYHQFPTAAMMVFLRTTSDPLTLAGPLRAAVRELDPAQPVSDLRPFASLLDERLAQRRLTTVLAGVFAGVATLLALVGVYGVLSHAVAQGTREIGLRMALGAANRDVLRLIFRRVAGMLVLGVGLGLLGGLLAARAIAVLLYGIGALDPATFALAPLLLTSVALLACYLPAHRAMRVDPGTALRIEA